MCFANGVYAICGNYGEKKYTPFAAGKPYQNQKYKRQALFRQANRADPGYQDLCLNRADPCYQDRSVSKSMGSLVTGICAQINWILVTKICAQIDRILDLCPNRPDPENQDHCPNRPDPSYQDMCPRIRIVPGHQELCPLQGSVPKSMGRRGVAANILPEGGPGGVFVHARARCGHSAV